MNPSWLVLLKIGSQTGHLQDDVVDSSGPSAGLPFGSRFRGRNDPLSNCVVGVGVNSSSQ